MENHTKQAQYAIWAAEFTGTLGGLILVGAKRISLVFLQMLRKA
jgi:hypothetical protein